MKKHLIAAAVTAAVAVPAMAQNVNLSGTMDINPWSSYKATVGNATNKRTGTLNESSRAGGWATSNLAFSGTEDLGGGLRASFFFNQELRQTNGSLNARDYWLALRGGFGEVKIGRQPTAVEGGWGAIAVSGTTLTPGNTDTSGYDLIAGTLGATQDVLYSTDTTGAGSMARQSGVIRYTTPNMSGLVVSVDYANNGSDTSATPHKTKADQISGSATYTINKQARVIAGMGNRETTTENVAGTAKSELYYVGGTYNFGVAEVRYAFGSREDKALSGAVASDISVHNIGVIVPVTGAVTLTASFYDGEDKRNGLAANKRDLSGYQLSARYALSKRTFAYVATGKNENEGVNVTTTAKLSGTNFGLVHSF
jgi:predicted porin